MIYRFAEYELDTNQARLTRGEKEIALQPKVFEALLLLVRNPGQLVTKQELMETLWPETFVNEEALAQIIFKLRRALGDTRDEPRFVQTVLKRGFRFLPDVSTEPDDRDYQTAAAGEGNLKTSESSDGRTGSTIAIAQEEDRHVKPPDKPREDPPHEMVAGDRLQAAQTERPAVLDVSSREVHRSRWRRWAIPVSIVILMAAGSAVAVRQWFVSRKQTASPAVPDGRKQKVRRITYFPERNQDADIAPDGTIVFVSKHEGDGLFKLYRVSTAGEEPVRLTRSEVEEQTPRFSRDGNWIVYRRDGEGGVGHSVWRVAARGGEASLLVADAALPDWSPDGREILFIRGLANGECALMRMPIEDKAEQLILARPELIDMPAWSPDGNSIAFVNREALWVVSAEGGSPRRVTGDEVTVQTLTWAPDSKAIICDATWGGTRNLWMIPLEGDSPPVPITAGSGVDIYPAITPDWKYLVYTTERWERLVWTVDKNGRHPVKVQSRTTFESISIDSNGRSLAYSDFEPNPGDRSSPGNAIGLLDVKTLEQRRLESGYCPVFSPDAKQLAFLREGKEGGELHVMDVATGALRRVTQTLALRVEPAWSRDTRIVFHRSDTGQNPGLTIVDAVSGTETLLAEGNYSAPAWSPDGQWIAASGTGNEGRGLYLFDVSTLQGRRISATCSYEAAPIWSADSRSLQILVDERKRPALLTLSIGGAASSRMDLEFTPDPNFWGIFLVKPTPDGYVYLLQRVSGDIYMAENPAHTP
jgi:Tol biopolymer transport system component/DNA-binding winged helix-turn-helix (wHTH) protein